ncbi:hypothetical protein [Rhizobium sp. NFR03]|uniref:hypothetical protein n=1 Tax=Rhizobium sp. NFR03 TaxID=1566263 RepID=UPI000AB6EB6A|nr:hypothetical protein [Rhizobium sp. NFR03]
MADDLDGSFYEGLIEGQLRGSFAGACPYRHDRPNLRLNWMEGFACGRQHPATIAGPRKISQSSDKTIQTITLPYFDGRMETFTSYEEVGRRLKELQEQGLILTLVIDHPCCVLRPIDEFDRMLRRHLQRQIARTA